MGNLLLAAALEYASQGWHVHPCAPRGKTALVSWGSESTTDTEQLKRWWSQWPEANVGISCGPSGLLVIDLDLHSGGLAKWRALLQVNQAENLRTPMAISGSGGEHWYFALGGHTLGNSPGRLPEGIDVRGIGGQIIAPPSIHPSGNAYQWRIPPDAEPLAPIPDWLLSLLLHPPKPSAFADGPITAGKRNTWLFMLGTTLSKKGLDEKSIYKILQLQNEQRCNPPLALDEIHLLTQGAMRYRGVERVDWTAPEFVDELTDLGNASRMVALFQTELRYGQGVGWLHWESTHWEPNQEATAIQFAKETTRALQQDAQALYQQWSAMASGTPEERQARNEIIARWEAIRKWAHASQSAQRIEALLRLASTEPEILVLPSELDSDPWKVACENGTLNLATGQLTPSQRSDLITRKVLAPYDPEARDARWERFLQDCTDGDKDLEEYLQRIAGLALTGHRSEELFFFHGPTKTGKSTFVEAIRGLMGSYGKVASFDTFVKGHAVGAIRNDLAILRGARLVTSVEVEEGRKLAGALVKQLTGRDTITARLLYHEAFEFAPIFKLWLVANFEPIVNSEDAAIWERIRKIPFVHSVPPEKRDPTLPAYFASSARPAILTWIVSGAKLWCEKGTTMPESVWKASLEYRNNMDPLRDFVAECCELAIPGGANLVAPAVELRLLYERWCHTNNLRPIGARRWGAALRRYGCRPQAIWGGSGTQKAWVGIALKVS